MKILVVEDDTVSRKILENYLSKYGECHLASDGLAGLNAFEEALNADSAYELVCLDIKMPKMDGQEVLKKIRALEEKRKLKADKKSKILITSAMDDKDNIINAYVSDCDGYLNKPFKHDLIKEQLQILGLVKGDKSGCVS